MSFAASADDEAVAWLLGRLKARLPELLVSIKTTSATARDVYLSASLDGSVSVTNIGQFL